jgi:tetratricopeptide (TPR) repeat protein
LFTNVASTLNNLDGYVDLELRPPKVLLDDSTSRDGGPVMAVVVEDPESPNGAVNLLYAVTKNSRFKLLDVQPGDEVRYFIPVRNVRDDEYEAEMQARFGKNKPVRLTVRQVKDNNTLLLAQGFERPVTPPKRVEVWRYDTDKIKEIDYRLGRYAEGQGKSIGWEPTPDETAIAQIVDRLNQWSRENPGDKGWRPDPLIKSLPKEFAKYAKTNDLKTTAFDPYDGRLLQEAVWLRDIAAWARGDSLHELDQAAALFDWSVRNIQLKGQSDLRRRPWQTLIYGEGTADERAWLFALLARQQQLDVVMLAVRDGNGGWRPWLPALLLEGKLYLFDPALGLPVPGPGGAGIATLTEAREDPAILARLDLDAEHPYPVQSADLKDVAAWIPASPLSLSRRAKLVEAQLAGSDRLVLSVDPSSLAKSLRTVPGVVDVKLWDAPFRTIAEQEQRKPAVRAEAAKEFVVYAGRPALWKARVLHFKGEFQGDKSARTYYRDSRPADSEIEKMPQPMPFREAKKKASYWLGLLSFDDGQYDVAIDYLQKRTLGATPDGPWTQGARYNLGRAYESLGRVEEAATWYMSDEDSPQSHGNRLRARWLREKQLPAGKQSESNE